MNRFAMLACTASLFVSGCATTSCPPPTIVPVKVEVPVPTPCLVDPGKEPDWAWTPANVKAAPDLYAIVKLLKIDHEQRVAWEAALKASSAGCQKLP